MDTHELAWAAGFFDGEGTVGARNSGKVLELGVGQVDRRPLDRLHTALGGLGHVSGPTTRISDARPNNRPIYLFRVRDWREVQAVIAALWRYLSAPKREQAARALAAFRAAEHQFVRPPKVDGLAERCIRGHAFDETNTYVHPNGSRRCRQCTRDAANERWRTNPEWRARRLADRREYNRNWQRRRRAGLRAAAIDGGS